ncbi:GNAT family N-acetyltransferase [Pyxidicoccus xibeiensis]|uniref:GNAT family N-acetyltransferase n=1 Tax=Pyxidicoccus xibeiensis TaxID=2906759 RepID=UPI002113CAE2|nr:GNAT family N-acetyltransferase [Pyxidicoccus xibeiensis]
MTRAPQAPPLPAIHVERSGRGVCFHPAGVPRLRLTRSPLPCPPRARPRPYSHAGGPCAAASGAICVASPTCGELAVFVLCWLDPENAVGELEPVGTAPEHRRKGVARALIVSALHRLEEAGARTALVYAKANNPASVALYTSAGFREVDCNVGYVHGG